jgi:hypothetical protein
MYPSEFIVNVDETCWHLIEMLRKVFVEKGIEAVKISTLPARSYPFRPSG